MDSQTIQDNMVVSIDYTVKLDDGEVVDTSVGREPLQYIHGQDMIIPGLEKALKGMQSGDSQTLIIPPAEAYGERLEGAQQWLPRDVFPADMILEPGMPFQAQDQNDHLVTLYVSEVQDDQVEVDYNHPLAGETLHFEVTIMGIRPATEQELAHGHVHSPNGEHNH